MALIITFTILMAALICLFAYGFDRLFGNDKANILNHNILNHNILNNSHWIARMMTIQSNTIDY